ncbi:MAG: hypothetical protein WAW90_03580 [Minisyncoccia bacterium]
MILVILEANKQEEGGPMGELGEGVEGILPTRTLSRVGLGFEATFIESFRVEAEDLSDEDGKDVAVKYARKRAEKLQLEYCDLVSMENTLATGNFPEQMHFTIRYSNILVIKMTDPTPESRKWAEAEAFRKSLSFARMNELGFTGLKGEPLEVEALSDVPI